MSGHRKYKITDYRFGLLVVGLREKVGLTQEDVGDALKVSRRTIQHWEAGTAFPDTNHLKNLIALFLSYGAFPEGRERDDARSLWVQADESAVRRRTPFDEPWFDDLLHEISRAKNEGIESREDLQPAPPNIDWGDAPDVREIYGRESELATLSEWVVHQNVRFVIVVGIGGIGKTTLSTKFTQVAASQFDFVIWRSLQNAPPLDDLLVECLQTLSPVNPTKPTVAYLLELMQKSRCLLVLDNMETLHKTGSMLGEYREGYENYQTLFLRLATAQHRSCVILTSRDLPVELEHLAGEQTSVRVMRMTGLTWEACQIMLSDKRLFGSVESWNVFVHYYGGNPLALKIAANTVRELFGGDLGAFLKEAPVTLHTLQHLLDNQFEHLSELEREIMHWLAIERDAISLDELHEDIAGRVSRNALLAALLSLRQHSLIERGDVGAVFNLQPVLLQFVTDRLVEYFSEEIANRELGAITHYALMKSRNKEYVRESQKRMILTPTLDHVMASLGSPTSLTQHLQAMVADLQRKPTENHGFAGGNLANLLISLNGHIRKGDFSNLVLRQLYLQGIEAQDSDFSGVEFIDPFFTEPIETIGAMTLSPQGKYLAASSYWGKIHVWRAEDGKPLWTVSGVQRVWTLAFNSDETICASGGYTGEICLWDTAHGTLLNRVAVHQVPVFAVAFQSDGRRLASGDYHGSVRIWNTRDMSLEFVLDGHANSIVSLGFTPDGSRLVTSSRGGSIRIWDLASRRCVHILRHGERSSELWTSIHPDGRLLASCSENDPAIRLWDIQTGECLTIIHTQSQGLGPIAFDSEGEILACGNSEGGVGLWKMDSAFTPQYLRMLISHQEHIVFVSFAQQGWLATLSYGDRISLWEARSGKLLKSIQGYNRMIGATAFSADGKLLVQGDANGMIRIWDLVQRRYWSNFQGHAGPIWKIVVSPDGRKFASCADDRLIKLWDLTEQKCLNIFAGHTGRVKELVFNPDGTKLASGGTDRWVKIWNTANEGHASALRSFEGRFDQVWSLAFDPSGKFLASGYVNGEINLWQVETGEHAAAMHPETDLWGDMVRPLRFSSDGKYLFGSSSNELLKRWDISSGECVVISPKVAKNWTTPIAIAQDGKFVVTGCAEPHICFWPLSGTAGVLEPVRLLGHMSRVLTVTLSPDERLLASTDEEGTTLLSDVQSKTALYTISFDRPYERMKLRGARGLNLAERAALHTLGAIEAG